MATTKKKSAPPVTVKSKKQTPAALNKTWPYAWLAAFVIVAVTYIAFSPSMQDDFTNWDDLDYVLDNSMVRSDSIPLGEVFSRPVSLNYHPLTILSLAWNYQAGKLDPWGYHLVNVVLHLLNTFMVFFFAYSLTKRNLFIAAVVSLFWGIHPMHVESVTWISERKDVLYVFFFLAGLLSYLRYRQRNGIGWYLLSLAAFVLSCLSKGMAVVFPVVLVLIDYYQGIKPARRTIIEKVPFFLIALAFGGFAFYIQQRGGVTVALENFSTWQRTMFASYGLLMYVVKLFGPFKLAAFHPYPLINKEDVLPTIFYFYPFIVLGLLGLAFYYVRKTKAVIFGLLFFLVTVAMVLQFISVGFAIMADRYSYLCYVGLLFAFASLLDTAWKKSDASFDWKYPITMLLTAGAVAFSYQTYSRAQVWKTSETLFTDEMSKYPQVDRSYWHRGIFYQNLNRNDEALKDFNKALEINPYYGAVYNSRAKLLFTTGRYQESLADCYQAIMFDSLDKGTLINCGIIFRTMGKYEDAEKYLDKAYKIDSNNPGLFVNRGLLYDAIHEDAKAVDDFSKYLKLNKGRDDNAFNLRGVSYSKLEKHPEAIADFSTAISLNDTIPLYYLNRSISEYKTGKVKEAAADVIRVRSLGAAVDTNYMKLLGVGVKAPL
jgi:tetratricopeptide (TPR) repeat protein